MNYAIPKRFKLPPMVESVLKEILKQRSKLPPLAQKSHDVNVLFLDLLMAGVCGHMMNESPSSLNLDFRSKRLNEEDCSAIENFMRQAPTLGKYLGEALMTTSAPILFLHEVAASYIDATGGDGEHFWTACWGDEINRVVMEKEMARFGKN